MKVYIAGKITGDWQYREKFESAAELLRREGHVVLNPAVLPEGMSAADYMRICFAMIDVADRVVLLPDWSESQGVRLEKEYCRSRESQSDCSHGEIALQSSRYIGKELVEL